MAFEITLRRMNSRRSKSSPASVASPRPMNTWRCTGSLARDRGVLRKPGIVDGHVAPAEQLLSLRRDDALDDLLVMRAQRLVARHEEEADAVVAGLGQREAERGAFAREEVVRDLHQHAGAVADQRIGADRAAMREVLQDLQTVGDDLVRAPPFRSAMKPTPQESWSRRRS